MEAGARVKQIGFRPDIQMSPDFDFTGTGQFKPDGLSLLP
jgi:hypothetical protein